MKKYFLPLLCSLFFINLSVADSSLPVDEKPLWIDVRTQAEFNAGHITGAILIPFDSIDKHIAKVSPNKNQRINLYCRSGARASVALRTLQAMGYTHVKNRGGYSELHQQGITADSD